MRTHVADRLAAGLAVATALSIALPVQAADDAAYFLIDGNPVAAKYQAHRVTRLPAQYAPDQVSTEALELVLAFQHASQVRRFDESGDQHLVQISAPEIPHYGIPMFTDELRPVKDGQAQPGLT